MERGKTHGSRPAYRVLICDPIAEEGIAYLKQYAQVDVAETRLSPEELAEIIADYDAIVVRSATRVPRSVIERGRKLKVIGRAGAGLDNIDVEAARELGVEVRNTPGANSVAVAEHTLGLIIALARHLVDAVNSLKAGRWEKKRFKGIGLEGKTLGIVGYGRIGRAVAQRARAFGMRILVNQRRLTPELAVDEGVEAVDLYDLLAQSDFVTLHVPLRPENVHMIGAKELAHMKPGAFLINTSRGPIVDEAALLEALEQGHLGGAALDVYTQEPPPPDHPLIRHPKVVCTPHIASQTEDAQRTAAIQIAEQIVEVLLTHEAQQAPLPLVVLSLEDVLPHEHVDNQRVHDLAQRIEQDGILANPPMVTPWQGKYIVLDGATRTEALRWLHCPHVVAQLVKLEEVQLYTWNHAVLESSGHHLLRRMRELSSISLKRVNRDALVQGMAERRFIAGVIVGPEEVYGVENTTSVEGSELQALNQLVDVYLSQSQVERTLAETWEALQREYPDAAMLVLFPEYTPEVIMQYVMTGQRMPAGITRFVVPGRVLRLNFPLRILCDERPLGEKNRQLRRYLQERLARRRVRYYQEPVILLDE